MCCLQGSKHVSVDSPNLSQKEEESQRKRQTVLNSDKVGGAKSGTTTPALLTVPLKEGTAGVDAWVVVEVWM